MYWDSASSYSDVPDENALELLSTFDGNMIIEGGEVASRHIGNPFLSNELHAELQ